MTASGKVATRGSLAMEIAQMGLSGSVRCNFLSSQVIYCSVRTYARLLDRQVIVSLDDLPFSKMNGHQIRGSSETSFWIGTLLHRGNGRIYTIRGSSGLDVAPFPVRCLNKPRTNSRGPKPRVSS